ncbi:hypothetical protein GCM10023340_01910 [Nocardioides marinquilinus]|uniref:Type II secretion system protein GspF domain-containing protein n=1 Tax=Nocardioides marinquilinus TaxID=1210400 RepID=A0ABP9P537_9ACTN
MGAVAVAAAVLAAVLLVPPARVLAAPDGSTRPVPVRPVLLVGGAAVALSVLLGRPRLAVLAGLLALTAVAAVRLVRARQTRRAAERTASRVLELCESLSAELQAGQPPGLALERSAEDWPTLARVAEAFRVGADVPDAWRAAATEPGARDLRVVAAAWQVAHRTGEGLADTLDHVARDLRAAAQTRRVVTGELASARATAKLVAALPLLALAMGSGAGGDPWGFLLGHPVGLACLGLGLAFALAGLAWIEAIARGVDAP